MLKNTFFIEHSYDCFCKYKFLKWFIIINVIYETFFDKNVMQKAAKAFSNFFKNTFSKKVFYKYLHK